ncbi:MAG: ABC transporter permease, partial [Chloroflexus sp.]
MATSTTAVPLEETAPRRSEGQWAIVFRRFRRHRLAMFCVGLLAVLLLLSAAAPLIAPYERDEPNLTGRFLTPMGRDADGGLHILGTDHLGRDYATRLLYASRVSLGTAFTATLIASTIGILLGMLAGYFGGWVDTIISRFLEIVATFPTLLLLLILSSILVQNINAVPLPAWGASFLAFLFAVSEREARIIFAVILVLA